MRDLYVYFLTINLNIIYGDTDKSRIAIRKVIYKRVNNLQRRDLSAES